MTIKNVPGIVFSAVVLYLAGCSNASVNHQSSSAIAKQRAAKPIAGSEPTIAQVQDAFALLYSQWESTYNDPSIFGRFWQFGSALTAATDLLAAYEASQGVDDWLNTQKSNVRALYSKGVKYFWSQEKLDTMWNDDFGWWGVLSLRVHDYLCDTSAEEACATTALETAYDCWKRIYKSTLYWSDEMKEHGVPAHGAWNQTPDVASGGVQNSITNGLFLLLSVRLSEAQPKLDPNVLESVKSSFQWFQTWIDPKDDICPGTRNFAGEQCWLIRDALYPFHPYAAYPLVISTQEQGIMLAAMSAVSGMEALDDTTRHAAASLLANVQSHFLEYLFADGVLQDPPFDFVYRTDSGDGISGKGVFMRYAGQVELISDSLRDAIRASVVAAWNSRTDTSGVQMGPAWSTGSSRGLQAKKFITSWTTPGSPRAASQCQPGGVDRYIYETSDFDPQDPTWIPTDWAGPAAYRNMLSQYIGVDALGAWLRLSSAK